VTTVIFDLLISTDNCLSRTRAPAPRRLWPLACAGVRAHPRSFTRPTSLSNPASPECRPSTLPCLNDASHDPIIGIGRQRPISVIQSYNVAVNQSENQRVREQSPATADRTGRAGTADAMPPGPDRRTRAARARRRHLDVSNRRAWSDRSASSATTQTRRVKNPVPRR